MVNITIIKQIIPNFFTVLNLSLGIVSIILASQEFTEYAILMIIISMFFDGIDGRIARYFNTQSDFGKELDSLCDVISFGVAPAFIMFETVLQNFAIIGIILTIFFPVAGAIRLARYNTKQSTSGHFSGIPIPVAGGILATITLYHELLSPYIMALVSLLLSYLMISNIKYSNFKRTNLPRYVYIIFLVIIILVVINAMLIPTNVIKLICVLLWIYTIIGILNGMKRFVLKQLINKDSKIEIKKSL